MSTLNDGGAAFARPGFTDLETESQEGMSLRAYFACRAPAEPENWFEADSSKMVAMPKADHNWKYCDGCKADSDCEGTADCEKLREHRRKHDAARAENRKRTSILWRWAWADAMIEAMDQ